MLLSVCKQTLVYCCIAPFTNLHLPSLRYFFQLPWSILLDALFATAIPQTLPVCMIRWVLRPSGCKSVAVLHSKIPLAQALMLRSNETCIKLILFTECDLQAVQASNSQLNVQQLYFWGKCLPIDLCRYQGFVLHSL